MWYDKLRLTAPMERNKSVKVMAVVMSCAVRLNVFSRLVTLSETLKKSFASQIHASHLRRMDFEK